MAITLQRTARTTYVKEAGDFGTSIATPAGRLFAYPTDLGVSGFLDSDVGPALARIDDLEPGDVVITNHPYDSEGLSTHMPDLHLIKPVFEDGRIVAHCWDFIHSSDIGGAVPSSISPRFAELYEEGFQIPPLKLVKGGEMNRDFLTLYRANCRMPEENLGDIEAMLAALRVGERRIHELVALHGVETFLQAQDDLAEYAAEKALAVQRKIPNGTLRVLGLPGRRLQFRRAGAGALPAGPRRRRRGAPRLHRLGPASRGRLQHSRPEASAIRG